MKMMRPLQDADGEQRPALVQVRQMAAMLAVALAVGGGLVGANAHQSDADDGIAGQPEPGVGCMVESEWEAPPMPGLPGKPF